MKKINNMNEFISSIPELIKAIKNRNMSKQVEKADDICKAMTEYSKKYNPTTGDLPIAKKDGTTGCVSIGPGIDVTDSGAIIADTKFIETEVNKHIEPITTQLEETILKQNGFVDVTQSPFNAKGDGSDETDKIQQAFNFATSNKKILVIPSDKIFCVRQIYIGGKSNFTILGYGVLKRIDNCPQTSGNRTVLIFNNCNNFNISILNIDGNILNNNYSGDSLQNMHDIRLEICNNVNIGTLYVNNPVSDSLYVYKTNNLVMNTINSTSTKENGGGRNCLSVISGEDIIIGNVISRNIGQSNQPGGVCIEPNLAEDTIKNIVIKNIDVEGYSANGISITNICNSVVENIELYGKVTKIDNSASSVIAFSGVSGLKGSIKAIQKITINGINPSNGLLIINSQNIDLDIDIQNSAKGFELDTNTNNFNIRGKITQCLYDGLVIGNVQNGNLTLNIKNVGIGGGYGCIRIHSTTTNINNITFYGDFGKETNGTYCFKVDGVGSNVKVINADMSGWGDGNYVRGINTSGLLLTENCKGYNYRDAFPTLDTITIATKFWYNIPISSIGIVCTKSGISNNYPTWKSNTSYSLGSFSVSNGNVYQVTKAGTSGDKAISGTNAVITDGTVVWKYNSPSAILKEFGSIV